MEDIEKLIQQIDFQDGCLIIPSELMKNYTEEQIIQIVWDDFDQLKRSMEK